MEELLIWVLGCTIEWFNIREGRAIGAARALLGRKAVVAARPPEIEPAGSWRGGLWDRELDG